MNDMQQLTDTLATEIHFIEGCVNAAKKARHTPGPWELKIDANGSEYQGVPVMDYDLFYEDGARTGFIGAIKGAAQANACLMAAAPDMLQALKNLSEVVESAIEAGLFLSIDRKKPDLQALKDALATVAKATGEAV